VAAAQRRRRQERRRHRHGEHQEPGVDDHGREPRTTTDGIEGNIIVAEIAWRRGLYIYGRRRVATPTLAGSKREDQIAAVEGKGRELEP
jgi:hypothetical protein